MTLVPKTALSSHIWKWQTTANHRPKITPTMASLCPFSSSSSSGPFLSSTVTQEEFKLFHNVDRVLYSRLVLNLDREPAQSMQVMALWLWLERSGHADDFIARMLSLPDTLLNPIAAESVVCLDCIQTDQYYYHDYKVPLLHSVTRTGISLQFFHENRLTILHAVSKIVSQVCLIAFEDITKEVENLKRTTVNKQKMTKPLSCQGPTINPFVLYGHHQLGNSSEFMSSREGGGYSGDEEVPGDDRTIFLTFSKGYPISQDEVEHFIKRKHGDCIEAIHMQKVAGEDDQPLYARLIVHSQRLIGVILEGKSKAKFSINGKQVWARKYINKNPTLSCSLSLSLSSAAMLRHMS